jgi:hypothetical protein
MEQKHMKMSRFVMFLPHLSANASPGSFAKLVITEQLEDFAEILCPCGADDVGQGGSFTNF